MAVRWPVNADLASPPWSVLLGAMLMVVGPAARADDPLRTAVGAFLHRHCYACHTGNTPEGNLNLETCSVELADAEVQRRWVHLYDRVLTGEMPPDSQPPVEASERQQFLESLGQALTRADLSSRKVVLRRLNRTQYIHTVNDLFDIHVDLRSTLPDDVVEQGFDTIGSTLSLSPEQMILYLDAADQVLDEVFGPAQPPRRIRRTVNLRDLGARETADRVEPDGVVLFSGAKSLALYELSVRGPAAYRLVIEAQAVQTDRPVVMEVEGGVTGRIPGHSAGFFEIPPGRRTTIEVIDRAVEHSDTFAFRLMRGFPWWSVNAAEYRGPGLFLGDITMEGPLEEWPRRSRTHLLGAVDPRIGNVEDAREILLRILPRAFRRPVVPDAATPYIELARQALAEGKSFEVALRRALKAMLCAPEFLFLEEPVNEASDDSRPPIDDFALASRLSYFLCSTLPDAELVALAERGELHLPENLARQVERLLQDRRSDRFVVSFTDQWLRLRDIDFTVPNAELYPEYDPLLRRSMLDETRSFFREILDRNHSVLTFLDSDFAMLNGPLAEFYGIGGVTGLEMQRVVLPPDSLRGGVLTHASVLKVSADGTRTSPVLRGAWVLKYLFGTPAPPPPPTVSAIEPDIRGAATIREQLARHSNHADCSRCHRLIDPPGFALECFDVIGGERQWHRVSQGGKPISRPLHPEAPRHHVRYRQGPPVDSTGHLPDGRSFADIREYRRLLRADETAMPQALTRLLMSYALGRHLGFSDRPEVDRIVAEVREEDYGLRSIIREVVLSPLFREP